MKKAIILIGDACTGKSRCARIIAQQANGKNSATNPPHFIEFGAEEINDLSELSHFHWSECRANTKTVIVDNVGEDFNYESIFNLIEQGVRVERRNEIGFLIKPRFIFTTNHKPKDIENMSFKARFEVIHL